MASQKNKKVIFIFNDRNLEKTKKNKNKYLFLTKKHGKNQGYF